MAEKLSPPLLTAGFKCLVFSLVLYFLTGVIQLRGQVLKDTATLKLVKVTVDRIYNMRFREAAVTCDEISKIYPDHPVVFLLRGLITYWEGFPLLSGSSSRRDFEDQMYSCIDKSEDFEPEHEAEFLLASLCARGSLLAFYTGNDLHSKAFSLGRTTYRYLRRSFRFTDAFPDFLFFTGLYNYYREAYPEAHPVYKPLLAVFPAGNKERGMYELRKAFRESIFLKAEASTFLSSNYKYFENDFVNALYYSRAIFKVYPMNTVYRVNCIEDLLLTKKYDEAEKLIGSTVLKEGRGYFRAQLTILTGVLNEKKYGNIEKAEKEYSEGIEDLSSYSNYGKQYMAYAYFGLSRISGLNNDRQNERIYRRKAKDLADFGNVSFDEQEN